MRPTVRNPVVTLALIVAAVAVRLLEAGPPIQPLVLGLFLVLAPGAVLVGEAPRWPGVVWLTAVLASSISVSILVSTALLYTGWWTPDRVLIALVVGCLLGLALRQRDRAPELVG